MPASRGDRLIRQMNRIDRSGREGGAAAIEFALVAWPLILIIGAICEVGLFLLIQFELQNAVDDAARQIRVNTVASQTLTAARLKQEICQKIVMINNCETAIQIDVRSAPKFADLRTLVPPPENVGPSAAGNVYTEHFSPSSAGQVGALTVTYDWRFLFPFMRIFSNVDGHSAVRRLYGISVFRNET